MSDLCWNVDRYRVTVIEPGEPMRMDIARTDRRSAKVPDRDADALRRFFSSAIQDPSLVPHLIAGDADAIEEFFKSYVRENGLKFGAPVRKKCEGCGRRVQWRDGDKPKGRTIDSGQFVCRKCLDELSRQT